MISWLLGGLFPYVAAGAVALLGILGGYMAGRRNARLRGKNEALRGHIKTREKVDAAPVTSDPAVARERLRERDPDKP